MGPLPSPALLPEVLRTPLTRFVGRRWTITRIASWQRRGAHWLTVIGPPGVGKSAFAARLVEISRGEGPPTAAPDDHVFLHAANFCRRQDFTSIDPHRVLAHLAVQLSNSVPGYAEALAESRTDSGVNVALSQQTGPVSGNATVTLINQLVVSDPGPRRAWDLVLRRPLEKLAKSDRLKGPIWILIDGLDEAVEGHVGYDLARLLDEERYKPVPGARFLITTRPGAAADRVGMTGRDEVIDLIADQPAYCDDVLEYSRRLLSEHFVDASQAERTAVAIGLASSGNFLYAVHVVDDIVTGRRRPWASGDEPLPVGLTGYYRDFLSRRIAAETDAWRRAYRPVLAVITESRGEGLTREQLRSILGGRDRLTYDLTLDDVIADCAPYLYGDRPHGPFQLYHQSFRDYLRKPGEHHVFPAEATRDIVAGLLRRVERDEVRHWRESDQYTRRHLLAHAVNAGEADGLLFDLEFLVYTDAAALTTTLRRMNGPDVEGVAALLGLDGQRRVPDLPSDPALRRDIMAINAALLGRSQAHTTLAAGADQGALLPFLRWASAVPESSFELLSGVAHTRIDENAFLVAAFHTATSSEVRFWEVETGGCRADLTFKLRSDRDTSIAGHHDAGRSLLAVGGGGYESFTTLYDLTRGEDTYVFDHMGYTSSVAFAGHGASLCVVGVGDDYPDFHGNPRTEGTLCVFWPATSERKRLHVGDLPLVMASGEINGKTVVITCNGAGDLVMWDVKGSSKPDLLARTDGRVNALAFVRHGAAPLLLATGKDASIYDVARRAIVHRLPSADGHVTVACLVTMRGGTLLAVEGYRSGLIRVIDVSRPGEAHRLCFPDEIAGLAVDDLYRLAVTFQTGVALIDLAGWWSSLASGRFPPHRM